MKLKPLSKIYVLYGPPASGKKTLANLLYKFGVERVVSHTTRLRRPYERDGIDYFFTDKTNFYHNELFERIVYDGNFFGISQPILTSKLKTGKPVVLVMNKKGLIKMKNLFKNRVVSIYVMSTRQQIIDRIMKRDETLEFAESRIDYYYKSNDPDEWKDADFVIKNSNHLNSSLMQILTIMDLTVLDKIKLATTMEQKNLLLNKTTRPTMTK